MDEPAPPTSLSVLVARTQAGDAQARDQLFSTLYKQLHRLSRRELARLGPHAPMGATTLLHEAYINLAQRDGLAFATEGHFVAYAARAMRGVVIDRLRERHAQKRGGGLDITALNTEHAEQFAAPERLVEMGDALDELALLSPELAQVVDLKFFCGFPMVEIARLTGHPLRTVERQWEKARLLLFRTLQPEA